MYTRLFYGTIQPGKFAEASRLLEEFSHKVAQQKGYALGQLLQSGDDIVGITSWHTREDLAAYADSELARELFRSITPLFLGVPTVRTYEVKLDFTDGVGKK